MIVVMEQGATEEQVEHVIDRLVQLNFSVHRSTGMVHTVLGGVGPEEEIDPEEFRVMDGVKECHRVMSSYKLASRAFRPEGTRVKIGGVEIGGNTVVVMAGPGSVESETQIGQVAHRVAAAGAQFLRAGAFRPQTSPYGFQGLGEDGLRLLRDAAEANGLLTVSEIMDAAQLEQMTKYVDLLQVGAYNMQNFALLRELGSCGKPVLLKRGVAATVEEMLLSAEYILSGGNDDVILCERGIRTFETSTRHTLDVAAIPVVHRFSHLPVMADPSQASGRRDQVQPLARAAMAAGADGLMIEVHPDPEHARSDGPQSLSLEQFDELMRQLRVIAPAVGRSL